MSGDKKGLKEFGKNLRRRRHEMRLTQDKLAELVGVSPKAVCGYEWNANWPSMPVYIRLCEVLQMPKPTFAL